MKTYITRYGDLRGIGMYTAYNDGQLRDCSLEEHTRLDTPYGVLIPQYTCDYRRKNNYGISFYPDGTLRRISLEQAAEIATPLGTMRAELITFYPGGGLRRVFPLNGQLSGYWEEKDEYQLAKELTFELSFGQITARPIAVSFYESGRLKDITFWPQEKLELQTPLGRINARTGISLYPDGSLRSLEPAYPRRLPTPIGMLLAYDRNANGICGDVNSLNFTEDGSLSSLITSGNTITVLDRKGQSIAAYSPHQAADEDGDLISFETLSVEFSGEDIILNHNSRYDIRSHEFIIGRYTVTAISRCDSCESCNMRCSGF